MSTISRRTFLKLAGVTAVATAGASMLTGCKVMEDVEVTIKAHLEGSDEYTSLGSTTMPYGVVQLVMIDPIGVLNIVKSQYPQYKDVQIEVDKEVSGNGKILTDPKTGKTTEKNLSASEMNKHRLEYARQLDAERYKDERTVPLSELNKQDKE